MDGKRNKKIEIRVDEEFVVVVALLAQYLRRTRSAVIRDAVFSESLRLSRQDPDLAKYLKAITKTRLRIARKARSR
jgi:predicted transcriptional regulator